MLNPHFEEDLALKHSVISPIDQKPNFNWRGVVKEETPVRSSIRVVCPHGDEDLAGCRYWCGDIRLCEPLADLGNSDSFHGCNSRSLCLPGAAANTECFRYVNVNPARI